MKTAGAKAPVLRAANPEWKKATKDVPQLGRTQEIANVGGERPGVRYDQVVAALGGYGELVEEPDDVGPAFQRALESGVPAVVNVITDPEAEYPHAAALV